MARKVTVKECETNSHEIKLRRAVILFMAMEGRYTESATESESESDMATCMLVAITCA